MGRGPLRAAAALALAALAASAPLPAGAADDGSASIAHVQRAGDTLQILVSVPRDASVDLSAVDVTVDGTGAKATATAATSAVRRTTVLAIDTSQSMAGARFAAAKSAAKTFLSTVPDDVYVGIVSFNSSVDRALEPTLDRARAASVVDGLELSRRTRLYDGIESAVKMAGSEGQRSLLVLSDGADTSATPLAAVTQKVHDAGVLLDAVALEQGARTPAPLTALARAGQGTVVQASPAALRRAFTAEADVLARQVLVTAELPASVSAAEATVSVTLGSSSGDLRAEAFTPLGHHRPAAAPTPAPPAIPVAPSASPLSSLWLYAGLGTLALGLLAVVGLLLVPRKQKPLTAAELAITYTERVGGRHVQDTAATEAEPALEQAKEAAARVLSHNQSLEQRIAVRLDGAGSDLKPSEWLLVHTGLFIGFGFTGLLLGGGSLVFGLLFLALGAAGPWWWLGFRRGRRRKKFESGLPDTLQLMSGSLAAGLSLAQSVDTIVREGVEPVASEFRRVLVETRLGISLDDALEGVAERFESRDFSWVVMAIRIQRQVGGNLAELLDTVADTMREREYMRRQVAALSAEGRMSAYVLGGLPPMFMLYLYGTNRPYVMLFFTNPIGWLMLGGMILLLSVGIFWMMKMVKVEV